MIKRTALVMTVLLLSFCINAFAYDMPNGGMVYEISDDEIIKPDGGISFEKTELIDNKADFSLMPEVLNDISENYSDFFSFLEQACLNQEEEINVKSFKIPSSKIFDVYCGFAMTHPELLLKTKLKYKKTLILGRTTVIMPEYLFSDSEEAEKARELMQRKVSEYVRLSEPYNGALEKALFIHDEIIKNCRYDTDYPEASYHAYGIFADNKAVCQGYSQAFYMIMRELGVETDFCISDEKNHMWNYIKLDGRWYHADLTWDDPIIKSADGKIIERTTAYHDNFLMSDTSFCESHGLKAQWRTYLSDLPDCSSDSFENGYIFNVNAPFTTQSIGENIGFAKTVGGKNVVFSAESPYCGSFLFSKPVYEDEYAELYFYPLTKAKDALYVYSGLFDGKKMLGIGVSEIGIPQKGYLYKHIEKNIRNGKTTELFFRKNDIMTPYAEKIKTEKPPKN